MKKCPYCGEEIQDEAIICRFCNRKLIRINYSIILNLSLIIIVLGAIFLFYPKYKDNKIIKENKRQVLLKERRQLIVSVCSEIDSLVAFLFSPTTYGESQQKFNNYIENLKKLKAQTIEQSVSILNNNEKIIMNELLLLIDDALTVSENRLKDKKVKELS